jgi:hypothetical protein
MKLFQFWDEPEPPADVAGWIEGFRSRNPEFEHVLLNRVTAEDFIARHYGPREVAAFRACAVPAMQADVIRLCALNVFGGVYIDADHQSLQPLGGLIAQAPRTMVFKWLGLLNNAILSSRECGDPFLRACLELTLQNIEARRFVTVFMATGPGVFNAVRALLDPAATGEIMAALDTLECRNWGFEALLGHARNAVDVTPELVGAYRAMTQMNPIAASLWIGLDQPAYKQTDRHWGRWKAPIYHAP